VTAYASAFVQKDGSGNGTTPLGSRLALGGLIAHDGSAAMAARPGVFYDGLGAVVSGTATTGTMTYSIRAAVFATLINALTGGGVAYGALDAATTVTTTAAPGSGSRTDRIWVRQHHISTDSGGADTDTALEFGCAAGVAIPSGAMEIATANMVAGTTHTDTLTITQTHNWVVAAGAPIPVRNVTERNALTAFDGLVVRRLDLHCTERHNGTRWGREVATLPADGLTHKPRRMLTRTATFSLPDSTIRAVGTWSADTGDDGAGVGLDVSGTGMTAAVTGLYRVKFSHDFGTNATGMRRVYLYKNATIDGSGNVTAGTLLRQVSSAAGSSITTAQLVSEEYLTAGDVLTVAVWQNSGAALTVGSGSSGVVHWQARWVDAA
jgi:hypothetical protein